MFTRLTLAVVAVAALFSFASAARACSDPGNAAALQKELLTSLNAERQARGLSALVLSAKLDKALASSEPLTNDERRARAGITTRQVTLR